MRTVTLANLRNEVRQRADIENDPHITDAEVTRFINESCAALHALIADVSEGDFLREVSFNTVAGQQEYDISTVTAFVIPYYKLQYIEANIDGFWRPLERWTYEQRTLYRNSNFWGPQVPISYRLFNGDNIIFSPVPNAAYQVIITYLQPFNDLVGDSDEYDGRDGWEEWVVWDAAIKCAVKDETDTSTMERERDRVLKRITAQYTTKDLDRPDSIRETYLPPFGNGSGWYGNGRW